MFIVVVGVIHLVWDLTQPAAAAAILLIIRVLGYAQQGYNAYQNVVEAGPAILELEQRLSDLETAEAPSGTTPIDRMADIEFDRVSYSYPNGRTALDDVSFSIPTSRVLGVVGRSGAGKSTLAELLLRMRTPTSGRILVDGADAADLSVDDWRRLVAVVPQEPRVTRASIADNIVFLRDGYSPRTTSSAPHVRATSTPTSSSSSSATTPTSGRTTAACRAVSDNGWPLRGRSFRARVCSSSTSRPVRSTVTANSGCRRRSTSCAAS